MEETPDDDHCRQPIEGLRICDRCVAPFCDACPVKLDPDRQRRLERGDRFEIALRMVMAFIVVVCMTTTLIIVSQHNGDLKTIQQQNSKIEQDTQAIAALQTQRASELATVKNGEAAILKVGNELVASTILICQALGVPNCPTPTAPTG